MSDDNHKKFGATTPGKRFMKLAGMSASIAGNFAKNRIKGALGTLSEEERLRERELLFTQVGEQIANTLGEMKGAVMKVGQIASQFKDVFPKEIADALAKLQKESPPMPFAVIERQIRMELGREAADIFAHIDSQPFAAASIGQVHRARTHDGEEVVIKVQYPGIDQCVESDLKHLRMALKLAGVLRVDKNMLDDIFGEIRRSLHDELDYVKEAENVRKFAAFHATDPKIVVPRVFEEYTSRRVLTMAYEPGDDIRQVQAPAYSQDSINEIGHRLFNAIGAQIYGLHAVHCDPHPGNFAFRTDGSLIIYDYGCVKHIKPEIVEALRKTTRAALDNDLPALELALIAMGVRNTENAPQLPGDFYAPWIDLILQPFSESSFDFGLTTLHEDFVRQARHSFKYWTAFQPSADSMLVNRAVAGHYWTLKQLGVNTAFRDALNKTLDRQYAG
ncbi:MAG: AarF/ABC1/UbiB kinase family protein [bacterium]|nr:AarF/ABC1/UbiB kinase family protein [bacterium]